MIGASRGKGPSRSTTPHRSQLNLVSTASTTAPQGDRGGCRRDGSRVPASHAPAASTLGQEELHQTHPLRVRKRSHRAGTCNFLAARGL